MFKITPSRVLRVVCVSFLFLTILLALTFDHQSKVSDFYGQSVRISGTIVDIDYSETRQKIIVYYLLIDDAEIKDRIIIFAPLYPPLSYGDLISTRCLLEKPEPFEEFRYDRYLAAKKVYATCFVNSVPLKLDSGKANQIKDIILRSRALFISHLDKTFGEPHGSLLAGLLLGEQRFTDEWQEKFLRTGTTHIVAASGYNVFVVVYLMTGLLASFGIKRSRAISLMVASVVCYVILAGADAAVVRAGVMGILVLLSRYLGRSSTMVNVLLITASLMLLENPLMIFDVGFRLSMFSTIALIYLAPVIDKKLKFIPKTFEIRSSISATLSATFMALPVILLSFKSFSFASIITNLLILPFIPYVMGLGALAVATSFLNVQIAAIVSGPAWAILSVMLWVIKTVSDLPLFISNIPVCISVVVTIIWITSVYILWKLIGKKYYAFV
ncbi:hypothetical protein CO057_00265 [Candidatus Uhrbacteria bacterium CG_4_9_14_0_2_um_filter_41_50]|uniref:Uncharacterized protein n=1 Tax=Candidatus Uhrbacteria bacterium CG_4_9_14_0_2_um_filter_41_50 TaxID=1975031 RepID=A0A2M8EQD5_9BACT|nr:MAG: hypothetical protein COZ45_00480 [Candidatus Uhrbacteria bacterium CG_4_10_14_3_um_filter_41_21]PIZ55217.1 MAG: hypothetical protein COY24_01055 [Candidatus Uhrbacteria bacterium CG_4_10_14_0_2_um_filter_41_21]PJB84355.1 MAG: hypothetical protein CO086_03885 [Candidatus Uhrbacteria bacterium CG_4_9_14_0_8_um_filter_41_16]PJC24897.1 MAG: hypothetical protein CO057_00265 [Candidatus Uhrbacteria bacterium CG_4_9_14_0_2_um_filter_41_50]PJE74959.1 MAG: hypothetical protein COV03_02630 [Candi